MTDEDLLATLEAKLQLVRDRVVAVAEGYAPGLLLFGEGGGGKSYAVETTLRAQGHPHKVTNSRVTCKGLFDLLRDHPDVVHVVDDAEALLADKHAVSVLRSALWGQVDTDGKQR